MGKTVNSGVDFGLINGVRNKDVTIEHTTGIWTTVARRRATGFFDGRTSSKSRSVSWHGSVASGLHQDRLSAIGNLPLYIQEIITEMVYLLRYKLGEISENDVKRACGDCGYYR